MKKILLLSFAVICLSTTQMSAQESTTKSTKDSINKRSNAIGKNANRKRGQLTEEERANVKQRMQEKAANMSPAEKQEMRTALKKKFDNLSPEEKEKMKEKMNNRKDSTNVKFPRRNRRN